MQMGLRTDISSIAFDTIFLINEQQVYPERVFKSAVNWSYTNWKGMTFGILFGATLLSLMRALPLWRLPANGFLAALQGLVGGAPLGVCVNCATPIAQGLHLAGVRLETMLAVMTASPTLNLIVITMMLSLFSWYFVLIKLAITLFFIAVLIPTTVWLWSNYAGVDDSRLSVPEINNPLPASNDGYTDSWPRTIFISFAEILKNLLFLLKISLPLMLLAGILGAMLIESISLDTIASLPSSLTSYILIALIGTFLPVPIAFDVILTSALVSIGLPIGLAMTLFFSLSIFSIFPALIIGKDVSWKLSFALATMVVVVAVLSGLITEHIHRQIVEQQEQQIDEGLQHLETVSSPAPAGTSASPQRTTTLSTKISVASSLCSETFGSAQACLSDLLKIKTFGSVNVKLCESLTRESPALTDSCEQILHSTNLLKEAVRADDVSICQDFACRLALLTARSRFDGAVGRCDTSVEEPKIQLCRKAVLYNRIIHLRSTAACSRDLNPGEMTFCLSEVSARIAADQGDLRTCRSLTDRSARDSCYFTVIAVKIAEGEALNCRDLPAPGYIKTCNHFQKNRAAKLNQSLQQCAGLGPGQTRTCQLDVIKLMVQPSHNEMITALSIGDASTTHKPLTTPFELPGKVQYQPLFKLGNVSLSMFPSAARTKPSGRFERHKGADLGISHAWTINATDLYDPFTFGKGIASGDINNDGYPDLVLAFERGVYVYMNLGTSHFGLVATLIPTDDFNAFVVSLVDFNNDNFLDIFVSGYGGIQFFYISNKGDYTKEPPIAIPSTTSSLTVAAGFADLDQDADLDLVFGKWTHGMERNFRTHEGNNEIWLNEPGVLKQFPLFAPDPPGTTLSILLSDLNADSRIDIVTGNDRLVPDIFYFSNGRLDYSLPTPGTIPETSLNTMSYDSADFNNDLKLDLFSSDMAFFEDGREDYCDGVADSIDSQRCRTLVRIKHEVGELNIEWCRTLNGNEQVECLAASILEVAIRENNSELCKKIPTGFPAKLKYCMKTTGNIPPNKDFDLRKYPAQLTTNKFLMSWGTRFIDVTNDIGVARSNWSWNGKAFDIDNDRFQDILVGTGYGLGSPDNLMPNLQVFPNVVFHSKRGRKFVRAEDDFGLGDYVNTSSYTLTDFDLDGDMDIIAYGQLVGIRVFENRVSENNSITFLLKDQLGNRFCIGCKIIIESASGKQMREIKASGGFLSYDEPIALFGLDKDVEVTGVEVQWSTGEITVLDRPLDANTRYLISREKGSE